MKKIFKIIKNISNYIAVHKRALFVILLMLFLSRFFWLNYINWQKGAISNGQHGVKIWLDTGRYTYGAEKILNAIPLEGRERQFLGYIYIIAAFKYLGLSYEMLVLFQILMALIAAWVIYKLVFDSTKSRFISLFCAGIFLNNPFIVKWHQYILTESLYTSFVIFCFMAFVRFYKKPGIKELIFSLLLLIATALIRPNGWILFPVFIFIVLFKYLHKHSVLIFLGLIVFTLLLAIVVPDFRREISRTTPLENLQNGVTVWNHPELYLDMPKDENLNNKDWVSGYSYILRHPLESLKLGLVRVKYSLFHVRPYHSLNYKLRVLFWIIPAYILFLVGFFYYRNNITFKIGIFIIIAHLFIIFLTYAEHDSRFDIYILPVFYVLSGFGLKKLFESLMSCKKIKCTKLTNTEKGRRTSPNE